MVGTVSFPEETETILFREIQRIRQPWVWINIVILAVLLLPLGPIAAIVVGFAVMIYYTRLTTEIRNDGVFIRLSPRHTAFSRIPFTDIDHCEVTTLRWFAYGGPGILRIMGSNTYSLIGRSAVKIHRENDDPVLLGTQRPDELAAAITERL